MRLTLFGGGYVGLVTAACFAQLGNQVLCVEVDKERVAQLNAGECPIHEPDLPALLQTNIAAGRLEFTSDAQRGVAHGFYQFLTVGTPQDEDGSADLTHVLEVAKTIGFYMDEPRFIITKSTVPVGSAKKIRDLIQATLYARKKTISFDVASNPEFLREGAAVLDFMRSDRIIIGVDTPEAEKHLRLLYHPLNRNNNRLITMDILSAELTKYAANAFLATKISFINEMSQLAERVGADIDQVRIGIGSDPRIGFDFINPGCGYGGSCFPKDVLALEVMSKNLGYPLRLLKAVHQVNNNQKKTLFEKIQFFFEGHLLNKRIALWGLSFKPNTADMREAPSRVLIDALLKAGAIIHAFDPVAMEEAKKLYAYEKKFILFDSPEATVKDTDALAVVTEWSIFSNPDFIFLKNTLRTPVIFDGRNLYNPKLLKQLGIIYYAIGRGESIYAKN